MTTSVKVTLALVIFVAGALTAFECNERAIEKTDNESVSPRYLIPGILVESLGNESLRTYHVRTLLTLDQATIRVGKYDTDGIPVNVYAFRTALFLIPGIVDVDIEPYSFTVEIAKSFTWEETEPKIADTITKAYGWMITKRESNR